jgi:UDP-glucose 4-epimerase
MTAATILLTGATGYVGSHTWPALHAAGFEVLGVDSLVNSSPEVLERLRQITGRAMDFMQGDVCDATALEAAFAGRRIDAVVHLAALKAVGESAARPLDYYRNNVGGLMQLLAAMQRHGCRRIVFSSTATVYGQPEQLPVDEEASLAPSNPYASTKLVGENLLRELGQADAAWQSAALRYFNPVGAHPSGLIGEDPRDTPNNLMPFVTQVAVGRRPRLRIFGNDYPTHDGTGVRDYLHVMDLAEGHVAALRHLLGGGGSLTVNLGTGTGYSVLDVVRAFERASGRSVPYEFGPRRAGDVAAYYADPTRAAQTLGWRAQLGLDAMCSDSWRWQERNPNGFPT